MIGMGLFPVCETHMYQIHKNGYIIFNHVGSIRPLKYKLFSDEIYWF